MRNDVMRSLKILIVGLVALLITGQGVLAAQGKGKLQKLSKEVATLNLGFNDYVLGKRLTGKQKEIAKENVIPQSFKGTYKFKDGDVHVVASKKDDIVIGLYKENKNATRKQLKEMVGDLMMQFNEPTTMAHEKLLYWAYSKEGKLSEAQLRKNRENKKDPLTIVKFSSSEPIAIVGENSEGEEVKPTHIYCIISSDPLSRLFMSQPI